MMVNQIVDNPGVYGQMKVTSVDQGPTSYLSGQWGGAPKPGEETEKHLSARVMIDYGGTPVFVLKGTSGDFDWRDNGMGGYVSVADTIGQQQALDSFLEQMKDFPGDARAVVTGHSKGGNSAQYIGIVAGDRVEQVVSFDGQGFNRIFMLKYGPQIAAHGSKITNISHQHDYVNILLQQVFGSNQYFVDAPLNYDDAVTFERPHIPNSIFHNDGTTLSLDLERDATTQTPAMTQMQELIWFLSGHMTAKDFTFLCYRAVSKLMDTSEPYGDPVSMPLGFFLHLLPLLKNYLEVQGLDAHDTVMFIEEFVEALFPYDENPALNALISGVGGGTFAGLMAVTTSAGYAGAPRDFTDEVRQRFLGLVTETQTVTEWDYTYWDEW
ncbi:MAG: DUF2974 domain-containing protein, partial [Propionibacteriaceae bacterium]|nr:DUF2974 domain-containing protein [Propionibacteriaceae bacterium]